MRIWLVVLAFVVACASTAPKQKSSSSRHRAAKSHKVKKVKKPVPIGTTMEGKATWYGGRHHGGPTASGERFNKNRLTAAHKTWPMNTMVKVTHARTGKSVVVRINDRGPYGKGRIIDVSEAAAKKLGIIDEGVAPVVIEVVSK